MGGGYQLLVISYWWKKLRVGLSEAVAWHGAPASAGKSSGLAPLRCMSPAEASAPSLRLLEFVVKLVRSFKWTKLWAFLKIPFAALSSLETEN
jgi:hypothetical protein